MKRPGTTRRPTTIRGDAGTGRVARPGSRVGGAIGADGRAAGRGQAPASDGGGDELFAGRYRVERQIGRGGMGSVFLATQVAVDRRVAIKVLDETSRDQTLANRFIREARVIAQLNHPSIVNLIDFGEDERGRLYLVMEYIDGESLKDLIAREAPLDPDRVVHIAAQVLEALASAHAINVIHRDLKPDNLMVSRLAGRDDYVKVLDFGIAKVKKSDPGQQQTVRLRVDAPVIDHDAIVRSDNDR